MNVSSSTISTHQQPRIYHSCLDLDVLVPARTSNCPMDEAPRLYTTCLFAYSASHYIPMTFHHSRTSIPLHIREFTRPSITSPHYVAAHRVPYTIIHPHTSIAVAPVANQTEVNACSPKQRSNKYYYRCSTRSSSTKAKRNKRNFA